MSYYLGRVRNAVSGAASAVGGLFSGSSAAPAGTATNNTTRNAAAPAPVANAPMVAVPAGATSAPAPAPGGSVRNRAAMWQTRANKSNAAAKKAAAEFNKMATSAAAGSHVGMSRANLEKQRSNALAYAAGKQAEITKYQYDVLHGKKERRRATRRHRKAGRR